jgi:hypothetical protein
MKVFSEECQYVIKAKHFRTSQNIVALELGLVKIQSNYSFYRLHPIWILSNEP